MICHFHPTTSFKKKNIFERNWIKKHFTIVLLLQLFYDVPFMFAKHIYHYAEGGE